MKILICGDSWSEGYGVESNKTWPNFLNCDFINVAKCGASNNDIKEQFLENYNNTFNAVIIGWSGVTRCDYNGIRFDFSRTSDQKLRKSFFENKTIKNLENDFLNLNEQINTECEKNNTKLIKFSVFGDFKYLWDKYFTNTSCLDFLSQKQGHNFKYDIPFFEFDYLSEINLKNTKSYAKKYFSKNWKRAIVERDEIRPGEYFLPCGHPNEKGHFEWAKYIKEYL